MKTRLAAISTCFSAALLFLAVLLSIPGTSGQSSAHADARIMPTPSATPTIPPGPLVTMDIAVSSREVAIGETLVITLDRWVAHDCEFAVFKLELEQLGSPQPFSYINPPSAKPDPPYANPFIYTLQAEQTGTARFQGRAFGEFGCGGWTWTTVYSSRETVRVGEWPSQGWLPVLSRAWGIE